MTFVRPIALCLFAVVCGLSTAACQSPTSPDDNVDIDDILDVTTTPDPAIAFESTDGKTYRVVRGNNQPDDILTYDWKTNFTLGATFNSRADDEDALEFPVTITSVTLQVKQASGGIVTPPTGGETEYYSYVTEASSNRYGAVNETITIAFEVWYDLPSLRREALVQVTLSFTDNKGRLVTKTHDVRVAP
jgi:hypothetical protein